MNRQLANSTTPGLKVVLAPVAQAGSAPSNRSMARAVIFSADDFGRSQSINLGIIQACKQGVLTSTSLMVGGCAADEAVELARQTPALAVGLHLVLTDGLPILPPDRLPNLLDGQRRLPRSPALMGLHLATSRRARAELAAELRAQFERFAATGLPLSHVDGHMHMHVHPAAFGQVVELAVEFGARGIRLPHEPLKSALRLRHHHPLAGLGRTLALAALSRRAEKLLVDSGLNTTHCYGISRTGEMAAPYVLDVLEHLDSPSAEIIFHPTQGPRLETLGANPGDLQTLLDPRVREVIERRGIMPTHYASLEAAKPSREKHAAD